MNGENEKSLNILVPNLLDSIQLTHLIQVTQSDQGISGYKSNKSNCNIISGVRLLTCDKSSVDTYCVHLYSITEPPCHSNITHYHPLTLYTSRHF